jgi:hypothetical protein
MVTIVSLWSYSSLLVVGVCGNIKRLLQLIRFGFFVVFISPFRTSVKYLKFLRVRGRFRKKNLYNSTNTP